MLWKAVLYFVAALAQLMAALSLIAHSLGWVDDFYTMMTELGAAIAFLFACGKSFEYLSKELDIVDAKRTEEANDGFTGRSF